ncbi:MAG: ABC transporter ATP-binding protein [Moraxella sp.]|nr:ABC transporter ATP-binding protein [Moraxella sp.]
MAKLRLEGICHHFLAEPLFDDLSLSVEKGQVVSIVGASGVGKTTLFNIAAGLIHPKDGAVLIDGADVTGKAGHVGYMLQKDMLLPFKKVYENIALPLVLKKWRKDAIFNAIMPKLEPFGLLGLMDSYPARLSGGQRQRAALLRTYLSNDDIMLLDEPFSALDFITKTDMYAWFNAFRQKSGLTCLMITHDIDEAMYLSDYIYVLSGFPARLSESFFIDKSPEFLKSAEYWRLKEAILTAMRA